MWAADALLIPYDRHVPPNQVDYAVQGNQGSLSTRQARYQLSSCQPLSPLSFTIKILKAKGGLLSS